MASNKKEPLKAIPNDPFEDMQFSDSPLHEELEISETVAGEIESETSAVEEPISELQAADGTEFPDGARLEVVDNVGGDVIETDAEPDLDEEIPAPEMSAIPVEEDSAPVEHAEPSEVPQLDLEASPTDVAQQDQPPETMSALADDENPVTSEAEAMTDHAVEVEVEEVEEQHILFTLAGTEYAAHISNVTEIGYPPKVTPLPNVPEWIFGLANLRGDIISVVDLCAFMGIGKIGYGPDVRMLVAKNLQEDFYVGLIVDTVGGIRYLKPSQIDLSGGSTDNQKAIYTRGTYDLDGRPLNVLDLERLLSSPEMQQFEPA